MKMWYFLSKSTVSLAEFGFGILSVVSTALLVIGILGEYHKLDRWKKTAEFFALFVILGVGGELIGETGVIVFSYAVQSIDDAEVASLDRQLLTQGPRWRLLENGKVKFVNTLKLLAGQRITLIRCGTLTNSTPEPFRLEGDLESFLGHDGAGWIIDFREWKECPPSGATLNGGNGIVTSAAANRSVTDAAIALYETLNRLGISTVRTVIPLNATSALVVNTFGVGSPEDVAKENPATVALLVGPNPMFDLDFAKTKAAKP